MSSPPQKRKAPLVKTFWRRFWSQQGLFYRLEMAQAANGPSGFWAVRWRYFSGWISPSRPLMLKKPLKFFWVERTTQWQQKWVKPLGICLALVWWCCIFRQNCFSHMWALRQARLAAVAGNFSCMVVTSSVLSLLRTLSLDWNFWPILGIFGKVCKCLKWIIWVYFANHVWFYF